MDLRLLPHTAKPPFGKIYRLNYNGAPATFSAVKPYIASNQLIGNPGAGNGTFIAGFAGGHIAIDNSGGPKDGLIYIIAGRIRCLRRKRKHPDLRSERRIPRPDRRPGNGFGAGSKDVEVGADGSIYFLTESWLSKYNASYNEVARMYTTGAATFSEGNRIAVDGNGAVWTVVNGPQKFEPDQLFTNYPPSFGVEREAFTGKPSPFAPYPLLSGEFNGGVHLAVDPSGRNDLYVNRGNKIEAFSEGNASDPSHAAAPSFGTRQRRQSRHRGDEESSRLQLGARAWKSPSSARVRSCLTSTPTRSTSTTSAITSAELTGDVDLDGGTPVTSCELQIGTTTGYASPPVPCTPSSFGTDSTVEAVPTGLTTGDPLPLRFKATNEKGTNFGVDRTFVPAFVLKVKTLPPSPVAEHEVTLRGSLDPDGKRDRILLRIRRQHELRPANRHPERRLGLGVSHLNRRDLRAFRPARMFHYRIVATNRSGTTRRRGSGLPHRLDRRTSPGSGPPT